MVMIRFIEVAGLAFKKCAISAGPVTSNGMNAAIESD